MLASLVAPLAANTPTRHGRTAVAKATVSSADAFAAWK